jgi:hypothetical protein
MDRIMSIHVGAVVFIGSLLGVMFIISSVLGTVLVWP